LDVGATAAAVANLTDAEADQLLDQFVDMMQLPDVPSLHLNFQDLPWLPPPLQQQQQQQSMLDCSNSFLGPLLSFKLSHPLPSISLPNLDPSATPPAAAAAAAAAGRVGTSDPAATAAAAVPASDILAAWVAAQAQERSRNDQQQAPTWRKMPSKADADVQMHLCQHDCQYDDPGHAARWQWAAAVLLLMRQQCRGGRQNASSPWQLQSLLIRWLQLQVQAARQAKVLLLLLLLQTSQLACLQCRMTSMACQLLLLLHPASRTTAVCCCSSHLQQQQQQQQRTQQP
jgi:hypothetical protein